MRLFILLNMVSLLLLCFGVFWESSMDVLAFPQNYKGSWYQKLAMFCDKNGWHKIGESYWNHESAWKNKHKMGHPKNGARFFGAQTIFVHFIDGWHLVKAFWLTFLMLAIVTYEGISDYIILDLGIYLIAFGICHQIFFHLISGPVKKWKDNG